MPRPITCDDPILVKTVRRRLNKSTDWLPERKPYWGQVGRLVASSNSHGQCYEVKFSDGKTAWYDPHELIFYYWKRDGDVDWRKLL